MSDPVLIVLIIAVTVIVVLFIFRRQLKDFVLRVNEKELDAQLHTHPPSEMSATPSSRGTGVVIQGTRMRGRRQGIAVSRPNVEVLDSRMTGTDQHIAVTADAPLVAHLQQQIAYHFSVNDVRTLCVDLGLDYATLPGMDLEAKTQALLTEIEQQQRLPQLIDAGRRLHPGLSWESD